MVVLTGLQIIIGQVILDPHQMIITHPVFQLYMQINMLWHTNQLQVYYMKGMMAVFTKLQAVEQLGQIYQMD